LVNAIIIIININIIFIRRKIIKLFIISVVSIVFIFLSLFEDESPITEELFNEESDLEEEDDQTGNLFEDEPVTEDDNAFEDEPDSKLAKD
jgi:hypothetical protein